MRRKITGETWEQMKTGYAAGIGRRESPVCSCVSITLRRNWTALYGAVAAQVHRHNLGKRSSISRRNSRNMCIRSCKCMPFHLVQV